jgi:HAE1 family hydrophobic/amphiphilic exporter-1
MELSLYGYIGLFMLIGIVKKNGILVIDFAIARQREGMDTVKAIHTACMERFRPIMMTTLAALIGQVPIAIGIGADGASRVSLGLSIIGGLVVSQIITLYITPVIYLYLENFQEKVLDKIPFFARELEE